MPFIEWSEKMNVGVAQLDEQHKKMFLMIDELYEKIQDGYSKQVINKLLTDLMEYTTVHFATEEKLFHQTDYPQKEIHIQEHESLRKQILAAQERFNSRSSNQLTIDVLAFVKVWVLRHIQESDKKYGPHLNINGIE